MEPKPNQSTPALVLLCQYPIIENHLSIYWLYSWFHKRQNTVSSYWISAVTDVTVQTVMMCKCIDLYSFKIVVINKKRIVFRYNWYQVIQGWWNLTLWYVEIEKMCKCAKTYVQLPINKNHRFIKKKIYRTQRTKVYKYVCVMHIYSLYSQFYNTITNGCGSHIHTHTYTTVRQTLNQTHWLF